MSARPTPFSHIPVDKKSMNRSDKNGGLQVWKEGLEGETYIEVSKFQAPEIYGSSMGWEWHMKRLFYCLAPPIFLPWIKPFLNFFFYFLTFWKGEIGGADWIPKFFFSLQESILFLSLFSILSLVLDLQTIYTQKVTFSSPKRGKAETFLLRSPSHFILPLGIENGEKEGGKNGGIEK